LQRNVEGIVKKTPASVGEAEQALQTVNGNGWGRSRARTYNDGIALIQDFSVMLRKILGSVQADRILIVTSLSRLQRPSGLFRCLQLFSLDDRFSVFGLLAGDDARSQKSDASL
jgi:hypothetical protein